MPLCSVHMNLFCTCRQTKKRFPLLSTVPSQDWPSAALHKSTDVWLHCFTVLISAPPECSVSRPTCHCQQATSRASRLENQAHQHPPGGPRPPDCQVRLVPSWGWMEVDYVLRRRTESLAEALSWLEHMVSPVILEPVGHLWMELLVNAGFFTGCAVVRPCLSSFLAEAGCSVGTGIQEWTENSWPIQSRLLPCRKPSPYPLSLAHQHPQIHRGDLALPLLSPLLFTAFVSPGCLLDLGLVNSQNDWKLGFQHHILHSNFNLSVNTNKHCFCDFVCGHGLSVNQRASKCHWMRE